MGLSGGGKILWLKRWGFICFLSGGDSVASCSFGSTFRETIFLVEGDLLFVFLSFDSYWLIVTWCIVLLLHPLPSVHFGSLHPSPIFFFLFMATPQIVGGGGGVGI